MKWITELLKWIDDYQKILKWEAFLDYWVALQFEALLL